MVSQDAREALVAAEEEFALARLASRDAKARVNTAERRVISARDAIYRQLDQRTESETRG